MNNNLSDVYREIKNCSSCPLMNREKFLRRCDAVYNNCDVFIISQALAERQLRLSGVNFFGVDGLAGNTGKNLEAFLDRFDRTIYPLTDIQLSDTVLIPKSREGFLPVYNTEITQCFPGKAAKGDRKPSEEEMSSCIDKGFLIKEMEIIKPKLLLLMGKLSRDSFFRYVLKESYPESLSEHIASIVGSEIPVKVVRDLHVSVLPIQHASGANPNFSKMLKNDRLIELIRKVLV